MAEKVQLLNFQLWELYQKEHDETVLLQYLQCMIQKYATSLDLDQQFLSEKSFEGPHIFSLPDDILQTIEKQLKSCSNACNPFPSQNIVQKAHISVQALTVICRNLDNIPFVSSCEVVSHVVIIASAVLREPCTDPESANAIQEKTATEFLLSVVYFLESLYDPYLSWRCYCAKKHVDGSCYLFGPAILHMEIVPFFYDCFHTIPGHLPNIIQISLLNLFGAILSGAKHNALVAVTPATLDVLCKVLSDLFICNEAKQVALQCLSYAVYLLKSTNPDERQVEISLILDNLVKTAQEMCTTEEAECCYVGICVLDALSSLLAQRDGVLIRKVFQDSGHCEALIQLLKNMKVEDSKKQDVAAAVIRTLTVYLSRGARAKKHFSTIVGFIHLCQILYSLGQPSQLLLESLLSLACDSVSNQRTIKHADIIVFLIHWLPDMQNRELQTYAAEQVLNRCTSNLHSKINCCQSGVISAIIETLERVQNLAGKAVGHLLKLLEQLASHSISSRELKQLFLLLRPYEDNKQFPYILPVIYILSAIAKKEGWMGASYFLDLQEPQDGIAIHGIRKWPGNGFTLHAWICLDNLTDEMDGKMSKRRRQLYIFMNSYGGGFEAFFTEDSLLVIATRTKKEYHTAIVSDLPLDDGNWHCIDICHFPARMPFTQSSVTVYIDGRLRLSTQLKFPSVSEPFTYCRIGVGGQCTSLHGRTNNDATDGENSSTLSFIKDAAVSHLSTLIDRERIMALGTLPHSLKGALQSTPDPAVHSCSLGLQDGVWGIPYCLKGQLGSLCLFSEGLQGSHIKGLYGAGPNNLTLFKGEEGSEMSELPNKLVLYYDAKAYANGTCADLSPHHLYDGHLSGHQCVVTDVKEVINTIGGMQVLYPLIENAGKLKQMSSPTFDGLSPQHKAKNVDEVNDEWVVLRDKFDIAYWCLCENQVAATLVVLLHMIEGHQQNEDQLLGKNGIAVIGALMQKVQPSLIDVNVLMAVEQMVEEVSACGTAIYLLPLVYQHILFDFRIWSRGSFPVRIGHIQYLSTILKDDRKQFRKKYGVQFILDTIQTFYSNCDLLSNDDAKTVRGSLLGLVKYYISRDVDFNEVSAIIGFLITVKQEEMVIEMLDMLLAILESICAKDQLFLLLYEPGCSELLYCLLLNADFSERLKVKVLKILFVLLKTDKVYEKSKTRLRLHDVGFSCLTTLIPAHQVSQEMAAALMDQILLTDKSASCQGALALLHFIHSMDITVKLVVIKKFLTVLEQKPSMLSSIAKQIGWQECVLGLLVKYRISSATVSASGSSGLDLIDLSSESDKQSMSSSQRESKSDSPRLGKLRRLSQLSTFSQLSLEESLPKTPQLLMQLKEHIFEFDLPNLLNRSKSESHSSSCEDLTIGQNDCEISRSMPDSSCVTSDKEKASNQSDEEEDKKEDVISVTTLEEKSQEEPFPVDIVDKENMLCQIITEIVFSIMWKGVDGSSKQSWAVRGQVFACINMLALSNELFSSHLEITRTVLEKLLQVCITDLQETAQASPTHTENSFQLMRMIYDFIVLENTTDDRRLSEKLLEGVLGLLDVLLVFEESPGEEGWAEMAEMGLGIVLVCADSKNLELCAMATAKLHALVQTRPFASLEETCHLLATIDSILSHAIEVGDQEHYSFLIPVVRALLEKIAAPLHIHHHLPALPRTCAGPAFFEDFQHYAICSEWKNFIEKNVKSHQKKYTLLHIDEQREQMNTFWNQCYEATMVSMHKRNREVGESKLRFQSQVMETFCTKVTEEHARYQSMQTALRHQNLFVRRRWKMVKLYLMGPRGPWRARELGPQHWKLSNNENFSRMRLKLTLNHNFDDHIHASRLRDNQAPSQQPRLGSLPPVAREARVAQQQEDSLAEEDLQVSSEIEGPDTTGKEKSIVSEDCQLVTLMSIVKGRFEVTTTHMYFLDLSPVREEGERYDFKWPLSYLREVHLRRYNLRRSALEFFLIDQTNFFLNFTTKIRNKIYSRILSLRPPNLFYSHGIRSPAELLKASGLTQKWVQREISNFDYLMQLNTIAGRTYNDLSQYPVFPWILADYSSPELDLDNPQVYRNLSRPIGVVNPKNVPEVKAKFDHFVDITGTVEKFHYGTHYSNSAGVVHYLVRMEPFTSLHIELQSNRFDVADRQFHSLEATWRMLMENPNDVKELIPEFFYLPEFLVNMNGFDLGKLQVSKERVNDVKLPQWASSPEEFTYLHRKALESEFVSEHIHEWIDLIFGYKQKGPAAIEALNVFYYVSYEGAVDLDAIEDPVERTATEGMINNFGQTPCQLLKEPHPQRMSLNEALQKMAKCDTRPPSLFLFLQNLKVFFVEASTCSSPIVFITVPKSPARSFIQHGMLDTLITVGQNGVVGVHGWLPYDRAKTIANYFTFEKDPTLNNNKTTRRVAGPFHPCLQVSSRLFVVTNDAKHLICGGHWDNSLRVYNLAKGKMIAHVIKHSDVITCLALDHTSTHLMTGSRDTTCMIWELGMQSGPTSLISSKPLQILYGHDDEVTCVTIATELDMAISASKDGTVSIFTIRDGHFARTLKPTCGTEAAQIITNVALSDMGYICVHCQPLNKEEDKEMCSLHVYSINGRPLCQKEISSPINAMCVYGDYLVTGAMDGTLTIYETLGLKSVTSLYLHIPILAVSLTAGNSHLLASLQDGKLIVIGISGTGFR